MIIHGERSSVQAEVFEGGRNDITHETNPWRRFWGGQCDSDASCTYIVSYCHYKKTKPKISEKKQNNRKSKNHGRGSCDETRPLCGENCSLPLPRSKAQVQAYTQ